MAKGYLETGALPVTSQHRTKREVINILSPLAWRVMLQKLASLKAGILMAD